MAENPIQNVLRRILDEQPSYVGELAYAADEELPRSFGKLMCAMHQEGAAPDELLRSLEAFGEAVHRVGDRFARVTDYYDRLYREAHTQLTQRDFQTTDLARP